MPPNPKNRELFARIGGRKPDRAGKFRETRDLDSVARGVLDRLGSGQSSHMVQLWQNWSMVMGADIAPLAIPLGSRNAVLLVGGEDNMAMQELSYMIPELLERANAFMDKPHFERVELHLLLGKTALDERIRRADVITALPRPPLPPRPKTLGGLRGLLNPDNPVARCYAAYLNLYDSENKSS